MDVLVLAKEPRPGRVKTRLTPPCSPEDAAAIATAALADTLDAALATRADRVVLALDGRPGQWLPPGVVVVDQGSGDLAARLARAWTHVSGPALQIGMDTPQVRARELDQALDRLADHDAVLGLAADGGWWALGLGAPRPGVFDGIPTSRDDTGARQHRRLVDLGLSVALLPPCIDVDTWENARTVAAAAPWTRFATAVAGVR